MITTPSTTARVSGTIKALEWDHHPDAGHDPRCDEHYGGKQNDLSGKNEYDIYPHPCADGLYVLDVMGSRTDKDFISVSAAKAAAQADYEARILAAIQSYPEPMNVEFGRQHFEPKRDSDRKPWDATTEPQSDHIAASGKMFEPQPVSERCETCCGNGEVVTDWEGYLHPPLGSEADHGTAECPDCDGAGEVSPATPSSAGTVSVEAAARVIVDAWDADTTPVSDLDPCLLKMIAALRALAGEDGR